MTRQVFDQKLQEMQDRLLALGSEVEENILASVDILRSQDFIQARRLIAADDRINHEQMDIETKSLTLIATQQPLATDLRLLASVIAIATELERINDYAKGIAKIALMIGEQPLLPPAADLPAMAQKAQSMLHRSLQTFVKRDVPAAYAIHAEDDEVDILYDRVYKDLVALIAADPDHMDQATQLLWAAHNLERTADRVSNICERVVFTTTGDIVEMPEEEEIPYPQS